MTKNKSGTIIARGGGIAIEIEQAVLPPKSWYEIIKALDEMPDDQLMEFVSFLDRRMEDRGGSLDFTGISQETGAIKALQQYRSAIQSKNARKPRPNAGIVFATRQIKAQHPNCSAVWAWKQLIKIAGDQEEVQGDDGRVYRLDTYPEPDCIHDEADRREAKISSIDADIDKPVGRGMKLGQYKNIFSKI